MARPKLIVFDLDYTLWPFYVDSHVDPPFKKESDGKVYDLHGQHVEHFPEVPQILKRLQEEGYLLGVASRTSSTKEASDLMKLFEWDKHFIYKEIYPGCKIKHFKKFHEQSRLPYCDMMFFDDEHRNIVDVGSLGVTCIFVDNGVSEEALKDGLEKFQRKHPNPAS